MSGLLSALFHKVSVLEVRLRADGIVLYTVKLRVNQIGAGGLKQRGDTLILHEHTLSLQQGIPTPVIESRGIAGLGNQKVIGLIRPATGVGGICAGKEGKHR